MAPLQSPLGGSLVLYDTWLTTVPNNVTCPWEFLGDDAAWHQPTKFGCGFRGTRVQTVVGVLPTNEWRQLAEGVGPIFIDGDTTAPFDTQSLFANAEAFADYDATSTTFSSTWPAPMGFNPWLQTGGSVFAGTNLQKKSENATLIAGLDLNSSWVLYFEITANSAIDNGRVFEFELIDDMGDSAMIRYQRTMAGVDQLELLVSGISLGTFDLPLDELFNAPLLGLGRVGDSFQLYWNNNTVVAAVVPGKTFSTADTASIFAGPPAFQGTFALRNAAVGNFPQIPV